MVGDPFKTIVENLPEVVWLLDEEFQEVLYVNSVYQQFIKRIGPNSDWSLTRETLVDPTDERAARRWFAHIERDIAAGAWSVDYEYETQITAQDGTEYWVETVGVPVVQNDAVVGLAGLSSDVTERVAQQKELEAEISRLDQFVSMVSHDLRTPLTAAHGYLSLYRETNDEDALEQAEESIARAEQITSDLLELSGHNAISASFTTVALDAIAQDAWDNTNTREATLDTDRGELTADESKLQTLLENLFRNAVEHGGRDVTVRVGVLESGFFVEDTGQGVTEDLHDDILDHGVSTTGSGIGLTIVTRIAELHNWSVELTESHEGGARFEFHRTGEAPRPDDTGPNWA